MGDFSHLSETGEAAMVRLGAKAATSRQATVRGHVRVSLDCVQKLSDAAALEIARTARLAGIQGAKQTPFLIPLCHPIALTGVDLVVTLDRAERCFAVEAKTATEAPTGVEMEALTAASIAALTVYDMIKAVDPAATIGALQLVEKLGGKHGRWTRPHE
jgi:cyclic pyranopterin phosphate synthase